ncbi:hypothetical protein [Phyllobacterium leguminum]|uniref:Uncharacterized protein n=1 Tax=Phyllobacterium leguminum TaxID=314237 RepID=A0A318T2U4_9HYPH|nr:hypothetical protein [Phyllobacterium leguminum]PYE89027.1 hypothetical protein C7477_105129 [Phyllobacterium leguminum]
MNQLRLILSTAVLALVLAAPAAAEAPLETQKEVNSFHLTDDFLTRMEAIQAELQTLDLAAEDEENPEGAPTLDSLTSGVEKKPAVMTVLAKHQIKPRAYIVGYFALMGSLAAAEAENEPQLIDELGSVNPAHIAFGREYKARIQRLIGE